MHHLKLLIQACPLKIFSFPGLEYKDFRPHAFSTIPFIEKQLSSSKIVTCCQNTVFKKVYLMHTERFLFKMTEKTITEHLYFATSVRC